MASHATATALGVILAVVVFLSVTDRDRTEAVAAREQRAPLVDEV